MQSGRTKGPTVGKMRFEPDITSKQAAHYATTR